MFRTRLLTALASFLLTTPVASVPINSIETCQVTANLSALETNSSIYPEDGCTYEIPGPFWNETRLIYRPNNPSDNTSRALNLTAISSTITFSLSSLSNLSSLHPEGLDGRLAYTFNASSGTDPQNGHFDNNEGVVIDFRQSAPQDAFPPFRYREAKVYLSAMGDAARDVGLREEAEVEVQFRGAKTLGWLSVGFLRMSGGGKGEGKGAGAIVGVGQP